MTTSVFIFILERLPLYSRQLMLAVKMDATFPLWIIKIFLKSHEPYAYYA